MQGTTQLTCALCRHGGEQAEALGPLLEWVAPNKSSCWVHEECALWAPQTVKAEAGDVRGGAARGGEWRERRTPASRRLPRPPNAPLVARSPTASTACCTWSRRSVARAC